MPNTGLVPVLKRRGWLWAGVIAVFVLPLAILLIPQQVRVLTGVEQQLVGTWEARDNVSQESTRFTFLADGTVLFNGMAAGYPSEWKIEQDELVLSHIYHTIVRTPVRDIRVPKSLSRSETFRRSITFTDNGDHVTLGPVPPSPELILRRVAPSSAEQAAQMSN